MQHDPQPFDKDRTKRWIEWNLQNYKEYGFGLWAVVLKETNEFIGDCSLTLQNIDGDLLPELGYHIHKKYLRRRFGSEAASKQLLSLYNELPYGHKEKKQHIPLIC